MAVTSSYMAGSCCVQGQGCLLIRKGLITASNYNHMRARGNSKVESADLSMPVICQSFHFSIDCCLVCQWREDRLSRVCILSSRSTSVHQLFLSFCLPHNWTAIKPVTLHFRDYSCSVTSYRFTLNLGCRRARINNQTQYTHVKEKRAVLLNHDEVDQVLRKWAGRQQQEANTFN